MDGRMETIRRWLAHRLRRLGDGIFVSGSGSRERHRAREREIGRAVDRARTRPTEAAQRYRV